MLPPSHTLQLISCALKKLKIRETKVRKKMNESKINELEKMYKYESKSISFKEI